MAAAAYLVWNEITEWAFVCAVLAVCSFFVSVRFQIKSRMNERAAADYDYQDEDSSLLEAADDTEPLTSEGPQINSALNR